MRRRAVPPTARTGPGVTLAQWPCRQRANHTMGAGDRDACHTPRAPSTDCTSGPGTAACASPLPRNPAAQSCDDCTSAAAAAYYTTSYHGDQKAPPSPAGDAGMRISGRNETAVGGGHHHQKERERVMHAQRHSEDAHVRACQETFCRGAMNGRAYMYYWMGWCHFSVIGARLICVWCDSSCRSMAWRA